MGGVRVVGRALSSLNPIELLERRMLLSAAMPIRIDAGGPAYIDTSGNTWLADQYNSGGSITNAPFAVANTTNAPLYYTRRWGNFSYNIPVTSGEYTVNLYFSESRVTAPGQRYFNVSAEGSLILTHFDAFAAAGFQGAASTSSTVNILDGVLNLKFMSVKDVAMVSAIELLPMDVNSTPPTPPVDPTPPVIPIDPTSPPPPNQSTSPWIDTDIGAVAHAGSMTADANGTFTIAGGGADIWSTTDAFNFAYQPLVGDGTVVARITSQQNTSGWAKSGIMIRESLNSDSRFAMLVLTPSDGVSFQSRAATHNNATYSTKAGTVGIWLKLVRTGPTIKGYISQDGATWTAYGSVSIPMVNNVYVGLAVTAHNNSAISTATFTNVSVTTTGTDSSIWSDGANAPMFRWEAESFTYQDKLYIFGGFNDESLGVTNEGDVYDPATDRWQVVTHIPVGGLTHAGTVVVDDTVYFAGGDIGRFHYGSPVTATNEVLTYNLATDTWGSIKSLPAPVAAGGLVAINDVLYYYGGLNATDKADVSTTWAFDLDKPSAGWVNKAAMPNARDHLGYVAIDGIAYAVGGQHLYKESTGNVAEVDAYDPVADQWTPVTSLPMKWSSIHTTTMAVNGKIVIVGGQTNGGYDGIYLNNIEEFDPNTGIWSAVGTTPEANEGESDAYIDNQLIVVGGTVDNFGGWEQNQTWITNQIDL
jgi:N-acetylneuraminic acid mutarotase/regulation of enolase protein 1 (concanavalin A-like superfamily)